MASDLVFFFLSFQAHPTIAVFEKKNNKKQHKKKPTTTTTTKTTTTKAGEQLAQNFLMGSDERFLRQQFSLLLLLDTSRAVRQLSSAAKQVRISRKYVRFFRIRRRLDMRTSTQRIYRCIRAVELNTGSVQVQSG